MNELRMCDVTMKKVHRDSSSLSVNTDKYMCFYLCFPFIILSP